MAGINKRMIGILTVMICIACCTMTVFAFNPFDSNRMIVDQDQVDATELAIYRNHPEDSSRRKSYLQPEEGQDSICFHTFRHHQVQDHQDREVILYT